MTLLIRGLLLLLVAIPAANAQGWPDRPVHFISSQAAGRRRRR